jgi:signal transduction histidine kinase
MHRLAVDLLDLSRLDAGTFDLRAAPTDLGGLLAAVRSGMLGVASSSDVDLELNVDPDLPPVLGDEDRLSQVFSNLVDNALKFTPRGGRVGIKADLDGGRVRVLVTDSGPGIKPEKLDRIFDRFYQADSARTGGTGHGSGLGLAIARELVQAHGGTINARSDLGHGTEFSVHLPSMAEGGRMPTRSGAR